MSLEKRITLYVVVVAAVVSLLSMVLSEQGGRITILMVGLAGLSVFVINQGVTRKFHQALRSLAERTGLEFVDSKGHLLHKELSKRWAVGTVAELSAWDRDGQLPYVAGQYHDCTVSVRVPSKVDHNQRGPEATRLAAHHVARGKVNGFTVYHRATGPQIPGHRTVTLTGDETFDAAYVVVGRDADEIARLLSPPVRSAIRDLATPGIRGLEFNAQGINWHEPGKSCDVERLIAILGVLTDMSQQLDVNEDVVV